MSFRLTFKIKEKSESIKKNIHLYNQIVLLLTITLLLIGVM